MCDQSGGSHKNDKEMTYDIVRKAHPAFSGLRGYIEKCCAKLNSSTMLAAGCKKVAQDTASFCSLPCRLTDLMEICRLLSLVACAIRVGGALKMTK